MVRLQVGGAIIVAVLAGELIAVPDLMASRDADHVRTTSDLVAPTTSTTADFTTTSMVDDATARLTTETSDTSDPSAPAATADTAASGDVAAAEAPTAPGTVAAAGSVDPSSTTTTTAHPTTTTSTSTTSSTTTSTTEPPSTTSTTRCNPQVDWCDGQP